jgi:vacuolar-type H+-ATPase subunit E/Vma4
MKTRVDVAEEHNEESLTALLEHVEAQCRARREALLAEARDKAATIRRQARARAAELLRETRRRERRNAHERVRTERARLQSRIRQRRLAERRELAQHGLADVRDALVALWSDPRARADWLARALGDAERVLSAERWRVRHPSDWSPGDDAGRIAERTAPGVTLEWQDDPAVEQGFVVEAGRAVVDATPAGLTARADRIAGVLLADLPADTGEDAS